MSREEIRAKVVSLLTEEFIQDIGNRSIQDDEYLEGVGMDSYAFVHMLVRIEEVFDIELPNELLIFNKWRTVRTICEQLSEIVS